MSRTVKFLGGVGFGYLNQFVMMLAGLWLTPFLLRRVGQSEYGLWLVGTQVLTYLTLMDLGVMALLPRETAYAVGRAGAIGRATDLPDVIGQTIRLTLWQMPLVALAAVILWIAMPSSWEHLRWPLGLVMAAFVLTFPLRVFQAVLQGLQDLPFLGKVFLLSWTLGFLATVGLVHAGFGLYSLAAAWVVTQSTSVIIFGSRLISRFPNVIPRRLPRLHLRDARIQLGKGLWVSVAQVAQVLVSGTDMLIIGKLLGPLAVVPYACTSKLIGVLANQPQVLMQSAGPALSEMRMSESRHRLLQVCTILSLAMLMVSGAVVCVVLSVNRAFVSWWVGEDQYGGSWLSLLLLASMLLRHWNTTVVYAIFCLGYERRISVTTLLDGAVAVCAMLVLVPAFGLVGAPIGMILGLSLVSLPLNLSALARENGVSAKVLLVPLWPWFWRFLLLATAAWFSGHLFAHPHFLGVGTIAALSGAVYVVVMSQLALRDPLGQYVRPRLGILRVRTSASPHTSTPL